MLNIIPIKQSKSYWCGPASLKMVLAYYKLDIRERELADKTKTSPTHGATAQALIETAQEYGLKGFIKDNAEFTDIRHYLLDKQIPVIVDWFQRDDGHYSVVVDINDKYIYLVDTYVGHLISLKIHQFYRIWFDFPGVYLEKKEDLILRRLIVIYKNQP